MTDPRQPTGTADALPADDASEALICMRPEDLFHLGLGAWLIVCTLGTIIATLFIANMIGCGR